MPAKPPLVGLVKVTFNQTYSGRAFGDSLYFIKTTPTTWSLAELAALATESAAAYVATVLAEQASGLIFDGVKAIDLSDTDGREGDATSGVGGGFTATKPLPLNSVAHFALEVARRYRGGRPGYNISGLDGSMMTDERTFSSAAITALHAALTTLVTGVLDTTGLSSPIINVGVSYFLDKVLRATPLAQPIADYEMQQRLCTLRKRMGKPITS